MVAWENSRPGYGEWVGPIAARRLLRRFACHFLGVLAVLAVAGAVTVHHVEPEAMDMGAMSAMTGHHDGAMPVMQMCLGAMCAIGAAVAAVAVGVLALGRWKPVALIGHPGLSEPQDVPSGVPRAGPLLLCLVCVSRR